MRKAPKPRNAYAEPAKTRRNAGPMVHKRPPREKQPLVLACERCGTPLEEGDEGPLCPACAEKPE